MPEMRCQRCGQLMTVFPSDIHKRKYCSRQCQNEAAKGRRWGTGKVTIPCERCGTPVISFKSQSFRYCSKTCRYAAQAERQKQIKGPRTSQWKGGRYLSGGGYYFLNINGLTDSDRALARQMRHQRTAVVMEHRFIMAKHLGRTLKRGEIVHHINGDKTDNRIENLELLILGTSKHYHHHPLVQCPHCGKHFPISKLEAQYSFS